jgi:hypothetical protein
MRRRKPKPVCCLYERPGRLLFLPRRQAPSLAQKTRRSLNTPTGDAGGAVLDDAPLPLVEQATRERDVAPVMDQGLVAMPGAKPLGAGLPDFCGLGLGSALSATASGFGSLPMIAAATAGSSL